MLEGTGRSCAQFDVVLEYQYPYVLYLCSNFHCFIFLYYEYTSTRTRMVCSIKSVHTVSQLIAHYTVYIYLALASIGVAVLLARALRRSAATRSFVRVRPTACARALCTRLCSARSQPPTLRPRPPCRRVSGPHSRAASCSSPPLCTRAIALLRLSGCAIRRVSSSFGHYSNIPSAPPL